MTGPVFGVCRCQGCGHVVEAIKADLQPPCRRCGLECLALGPRRGVLVTRDGAPVEFPDAHEGLLQARARGPGYYVFYSGACVVGSQDSTPQLTEIPQGSLGIGRSLSLPLRFGDPSVSRRHAVLIHNVAGVRVIDDRSMHGVHVNGERVLDRVLVHGDEIAIGVVGLLFLAVDMPPDASTPPATRGYRRAALRIVSALRPSRGQPPDAAHSVAASTTRSPSFCVAPRAKSVMGRSPAAAQDRTSHRAQSAYNGAPTGAPSGQRPPCHVARR